MAKNGPKWAKMGQNGPKWAKNDKKQPKVASIQPIIDSNWCQTTLEATWDHYRTILTLNRLGLTENLRF
ncbi:MAG: hypothetical protein GY755_14960 [Chloroflexi bacterium]|nr:hypothetical protein [Chloroflexota bacterium]